MISKSIPLILIITLSFAFLVKSDKDLSVIVVGSGPSGIAAATKLIDNGVQDVQILEAQERFGGRINSVKFGDAFVDLGAEFCHGQENSVVYDMAKKYDILKSSNRNFETFYSNGKIIDKDLAEKLLKFADDYEEVERTDRDKTLSIGEYFLEKYNSTILQNYKDDPEKYQICVDALGPIKSYICSLEASFSWFSPALENGYRKLGGDLALNWNGLGYKTILEIMMKKYPNPSENILTDDKLKLNQKVSNIDWKREDNKVFVRTNDGKNYTADHVIFTPSLGVLQKHHDSLFEPSLPPKKIEAMNALKMGAIMKIIIHFPNKWWPGNFLRKVFIWREEDKAALADEFPKGPIKDGKSWVGEIYHIHVAENNPNVLISWLSGEFIPELENTSDEIIIDGVSFLFNKFLGASYNITQPDEVLVTKWYKNPNFYGSYSYESLDVLKLSYNVHDELAAPLSNYEGAPVLLFAGEATSPTHYSTVHGAIETGYREAERLLKYHKEM